MPKKPPQIVSLQLENFRAFRKTPEVPLRPLTFLVGPNSSGKTSLLHPFFLIVQSGFMRTFTTRPVWSGGLTDLGSFEDCVFRHQVAAAIKVSLHMSNLPHPYRGTGSTAAHISFEIKGLGEPDGYVGQSRIVDPVGGLEVRVQRRRGRYASYNVCINNESATWTPAPDDGYYGEGFEEAFARLVQKIRRKGTPTTRQRLRSLSSVVSCVRWSPFALETQRVPSARSAPERWYKVASAEKPGITRVDSLTPDMLEARRGQKNRQMLVSKKHVERQLEKLDIANLLSRRSLSAYHNAVFVRDNRLDVDVNVMDVGFGASQVLPVLWALNTNSSAPLFLEQPEVHLHPRAQGILGDFIVAAVNKRQVVVETHSEHVINRARIAIAQGTIAAKDVIVLYIDRAVDGSHVTAIGLDRKGDFTGAWPDGFFDERFRDTMALAELRGN